MSLPIYYIAYIAFYGGGILFLALVFSLIFSARKMGLADLGVKNAITSFLFAILMYFFLQGLVEICLVFGCDSNSLYNFFSTKIFYVPLRLWSIFILFILSLFFSIKTLRAGSKNLAILLMVFDVLVLINVFMALLAAAWINAML